MQAERWISVKEPVQAPKVSWQVEICHQSLSAVDALITWRRRRFTRDGLCILYIMWCTCLTESRCSQSVPKWFLSLIKLITLDIQILVLVLVGQAALAMITLSGSPWLSQLLFIIGEMHSRCSTTDTAAALVLYRRRRWPEPAVIVSSVSKQSVDSWRWSDSGGFSWPTTSQF